MSSFFDLPDSWTGAGGFGGINSGSISSAVNKVTNSATTAVTSAASSVVNAGIDYAQNTVNSAVSQAQQVAQSIPIIGGEASKLISTALPNVGNIVGSQFAGTPLASLMGSNKGLGGATSTDDAAKMKFKVRLVSVIGLATAFKPGDINSVVFEVTPSFSESGGVEYSAIQPIHMPGAIQVYKHTQSRTFSITAHLISRNTADALKNIKYLQTLRAWRMPYFGQASSTTGASAGTSAGQVNGPNSATAQNVSSPSGGGELLGAPPEVLYLYAYSTSSNDGRQLGVNQRVNINRVPVVLTSLTINYPEDVDYLPISTSPTNKTEPFPVKMDVQITLVEAHSPTEYEKFSLQNYKTGNLANF